MKTKYVAPKPTKEQIASHAIRAMFFSRQYDGVVPAKDIEHIRNSPQWAKAYGKKAMKEALHSLTTDDMGLYMNLDEKKENWIWGGHMHEDLFPRYK